jgi:hypothetical protein
MDIDEVRARLHAVGVDIPQNTLKRWAYQGLIPRPDRCKHGKGSGKKGRAVSWDEDAVAEAAAVWAVRHSPRISMRPKRQLVPYIKHSVDHIYNSPFAVYELRGGSDEWQSKPYQSIIKIELPYDQYPSLKKQPEPDVWQSLLTTWIAAKEKAKHGWPIKEPAKVLFHWTTKKIVEQQAKRGWPIKEPVLFHWTTKKIVEQPTYDLSKISLEGAESDEVGFLIDEVDARKWMLDRIRPVLPRST